MKSLNRLPTNFSNSKAFLAKMSEVPLSHCDCCGVEKTNDDIIFQFDKFSRQTAVNWIETYKSLSDRLAAGDLSIWIDLARFIRET